MRIGALLGPIANGEDHQFLAEQARTYAGEGAANSFDGWIASGHYRTVDEVNAALDRYRAAGGGRAIVSTIQVSGDTDLGELQEKLQRFAQAGFDDAVVMLLPGAPTAAVVRQLID